MISKFFIERPDLANVIAIVTILIGGVCAVRLPVEQYPDITPPTVQVTTRYPGANAKTVVDTVALPIEQQVNGVEDMLYMSSYSARRRLLLADGHLRDRHRPRHRPGAGAEPRLVALPQLPKEVQNQGVTVKKQSTTIILFVTLTSPNATYDSLFLSNYATLSLRDELAASAGRRRRHGLRRRPVRDAGLARPEQAQGPRPDAAGRARARSASRTCRSPPARSASRRRRPGRRSSTRSTSRPARRHRRSSRTSSSRPATAATSRGVRDVARVELGAQTYDQMFTLKQGKPAAGIGIFQSPGANALDVAQAVATTMAELAQGVSAGHGVRRSRSTPRSSSRSRSTRSTRRCSRPACSC